MSEPETRSRKSLVADWHDGLNAAENSARPNWMSRLYARVYRFLLTRYGNQQWRSDTTTSEPAAPQDTGEHPHATSVLVDRRADDQGAAPRDQQTIQSAMEAISNANDGGHSSGPNAVGLAKDEWILLETVPQRFQALSIQMRLRQKQISAEIAKVSKHCYEIRVRQQSVATARELLKTLPEPVRRKQRVVIKRQQGFSPARVSATSLLFIICLSTALGSYNHFQNGGNIGTILVLSAITLAAAAAAVWVLCYSGMHHDA